MSVLPPIKGSQPHKGMCAGIVGAFLPQWRRGTILTGVL